VHELNSDDCLKSFVFRGIKEVDATKIASVLGVTTGPQQANQPVDPKRANRFLLPASESSFSFDSILEDLTIDDWYVSVLLPIVMHPNVAASRVMRIDADTCVVFVCVSVCVCVCVCVCVGVCVCVCVSGRALRICDRSAALEWRWR